MIYIHLMNLNSLDLNLLVALDALLREASVSRAAMRIGLSQPAASHALHRLRDRRRLQGLSPPTPLYRQRRACGAPWASGWHAIEEARGVSRCTARRGRDPRPERGPHRYLAARQKH